MLQESNEKIYFKIFPVSSHLHDLCKHGLFNTIETMLVVGMCFLVQWQKGNVTKVVLEHSSLNQCFNHYQLHIHVTQINSGTSCSLSRYLSGGIEPHSLSSSNTNLASVSRLSGRIIYLSQRAGILSQRSQRVNSTGKEYCESTGKYSNGRKILWLGSQTHQSLVFLESNH